MKRTKPIAFLLTFVMLITFTPISVGQAFADIVRDIEIDFNKNEAENDIDAVSLTDECCEDVYIEKELLEKRNTNSKFFLMDDGSIMEQRYGAPIHYETEEGFKEIDNSLKLMGTAGSDNYYENGANYYKVKLFENYSNYIIESEGYGLEFLAVNEKRGQPKTTKAELITNDEPTLTTSGVSKIVGTDAVDYKKIKTKDPVQPNVCDTTLHYNNVFGDVDAEYMITSYGVKENLVLYNVLSNYQFEYKIKTKGLSLLLTNAGEILAKSDNDEVQFVIPAPNMTDNDGNYTEEIHYELTEDGPDLYNLKVVASSEWLNAEDRSFPVRIDPSVFINTVQTANGLTLYRNNEYPPEYNYDTIKIGKVNSSYCDGVLSFPNANNQSYISGYQLTRSKLRYKIKSVSNGVGTTKYELRAAKSTVPLSQVTSLNDLTYSTSPVILENSIKTYWLIVNVKQQRTEEVYFDPEVFADCPDMMFLWRYKSTNDKQHAEIESRSGELPTIFNYYLSTTGIREDLPYEEFEYNGGSANVNLINGALTASFNVLSINTPQNPLTLSLIYNDNYDAVMSEFGMQNMFGNNIKINFQQAYLYEEDSKILRYVDEDGSIESLRRVDEYEYFYSLEKEMYMYDFGTSLTMFMPENKRARFTNNMLDNYVDGSIALQGKLTYGVSYTYNGKIDKIIGYSNGISTHCIAFGYNNDRTRVDAAATYILDENGSNWQELTVVDFHYDADGNLISVTNRSAGNTTIFTLEYAVYLKTIIDRDGNGYTFFRSSGNNMLAISKVDTIVGDSGAYSNHFAYDYTILYGDVRNSYAYYYDENHSLVGTRTVSRRFNKALQSEWYKDDKDETTVSTTSIEMKKYGSDDYTTYIKKDYITTQKHNTSFTGYSYAGSGEEITGSINVDHGVASKSWREYCISFLVETSQSFTAEIYRNGTKLATISGNGAIQSYYIIPMPYSSGGTTIKIKNTGSGIITISDVSYNYYTRITKTKKIYHNALKCYTSDITVKGEDFYASATYNPKGQMAALYRINYYGLTYETKNYTYNYSNPNASPHNDDLLRLDSITGNDIETYYSYNTEGTITTIVETKNSENLSKTIQEIGGNYREFYRIQTQNGTTTRIDYQICSGNVRPYKITTDSGVVEYEYDFNGNITAISDGYISQEIGYVDNKATTFKINNASTGNYTLTRNSSAHGLVTSVAYNGSAIVSYDYDNYGKLSSRTFSNGTTFDYSYCSGGLEGIEISSTSSNDVTQIEYEYTGLDLTEVTQKVNNVEKLSYQFSETPTQYSTTVGGDLNASYTYNYNDDGMIDNEVINIENIYTRTETYNFDNKGFLQDQGDSYFKTLYEYDAYNRLDKKKININGTTKQNLQYNYKNTNDYKTNIVASITNSSNSSNQVYTYNSKGYINSYKYYISGALNESFNFTYDAAGRLLSDGHSSYTYDNYNNVTSATINNVTTTFSYYYNSRLSTCVSNNTLKYFSHDSVGNIKVYKATSLMSLNQNLFWTRGNMLESGNIKDNKSFVYEYGPDNLRYSKQVLNEKTYYYWDNGRLVAERTGYNYTRYFYDVSGIIGMNRNGTVLFFEKNIFGDIINAYNSDGVIMASFSYDGFGNLLYSGGTLAPYVKFRYRGYYYDDETGFYYLKSRYYDPSICRFISADQPELIPQLARSLGELNLYSYCANNPIMNTDESGEFAFATFGIAALIAITLGSIVIGGTFQLVSNAMAGKTGDELWRGVVGAALGSGINALVLCLTMQMGGLSLLLAAGASAITQTGVDTMEKLIRNEDLSWSILTDLYLNFGTTLIGNYVGAKLVFVNSGWFKPQKFISVFINPFGQKIFTQTLVGATMSGGVSLIREWPYHRRLKKRFVPLVPFVPRQTFFA